MAISQFKEVVTRGTVPVNVLMELNIHWGIKFSNYPNIRFNSRLILFDVSRVEFA